MGERQSDEVIVRVIAWSLGRKLFAIGASVLFDISTHLRHLLVATGVWYIVEGVTAPAGVVQVVSGARKKVKALRQDHWAKAYATAKGGKHTSELDQALPGTNTKALYNNLTRPKTTILSQMRTGKCKLRFYLHAIGAEGSDRCQCV